MSPGELQINVAANWQTTTVTVEVGEREQSGAALAFEGRILLPTAYLALTSADIGQAAIGQVPGLAPGTHDIKVWVIGREEALAADALLEDPGCTTRLPIREGPEHWWVTF